MKPWEAEGISRDTYYVRKRKERAAAGLPRNPRYSHPRPNSQNSRRPWLVDGVSMRTWFRRQAKRRAAQAAAREAAE
jgi:hypothetical protein